jgi:hypothetical protein
MSEIWKMAFVEKDDYSEVEELGRFYQMTAVSEIGRERLTWT